MKSISDFFHHYGTAILIASSSIFIIIIVVRLIRRMLGSSRTNQNNQQGNQNTTANNGTTGTGNGTTGNTNAGTGANNAQNQQNQQPIPQRSAWETFGNIVLILLIIAAIWGIIFGVQQFVKWVRDPTTDSTAKIDNGKPVSISWPDPKMSRKPDKADDDKKDKETDENQTKKDKNNNVSGNGYKPPRKQNKKVVINEPDPDSNWSNREPIRRKQKSEKEVIINEPQSGQWGNSIKNSEVNR